MIRALNIILSLFVFLLFAGLYHIRYAADTSIMDIRQTQKAIHKAEARHEVLEAEWISLNNPARLEKLSEQHLGLRPLKASQLYQASDFKIKTSPALSVVSLGASRAEVK